MAHIDTLQAFEDLVASGISEQQAKAQVKTLNNALDGLATKEDLNVGLQTLEKDLKVFFGYAIGGSLLTAFLLPTIAGVVVWSVLKLLGKFWDRNYEIKKKGYYIVDF